MVISTIPEDKATKVSVTVPFVISFSNELKKGSVNENNFSLTTNGSAVSVTGSISKNIVVLLPASSFSEGTIYTASVLSEVQDTSGNSLGQDTCTTSIAWYDNTGEPQEVRTKSANQWGLFDLHGNVREWVSDNYSEVLDGLVNPQGPAAPSIGTKRSQRGGYYGSKKADIRSANRHSSTQTNHYSTSGFRVCADP